VHRDEEAAHVRAERVCLPTDGAREPRSRHNDGKRTVHRLREASRPVMMRREHIYLQYIVKIGLAQLCARSNPTV